MSEVRYKPREKTCVCGLCSGCLKRARDRDYYRRNRDRLLEYQKNYNLKNKDWINQKQRDFKKKMSSDVVWVEKQNEAKRRWAEKTDYDRGREKEKIRARRILQGQVARGKISRGECEVCGKPDAHAHHDDYAKPLDVRWFCTRHHSEFHAGLEYS